MAAPTLIIRDTLLKDPARPIPNQGVSKVGRPSTEAEWGVLRFELDNFVSEGEYERGLERILSAFLTNQGRGDQPGAWVSGFFGSGKSHFTRVLAALWADLELPDGSRARGLVHGLSGDLQGHLAELNGVGARSGGLWAASGTLSSGARSFRLAVLAILLEAAGLPSEYGPGTFMLWLREKGHESAVRAALADQGLVLEQEVVHLYVSIDLAMALLAAQPELGASPAEVLKQLREQFAARPDIEDAELVRLARQILASVSTDTQPDWSKRKLPATLLVLDELQQYIGDYSDRSLEVQTTVERLQSDFDGQVMVVATGQAALQSTSNLQKLIARFRIHVQLRSNDVDEVVRKVILEKAPAHVPALRQMLEEKSGEIDRHLQGTNIAARGVDHATLVEDYPLLPTRRRFWEAVLRAVDQTGAGGQLRSQLQLTHEATAKVAGRPLGAVIPGDAIFDRLRDTMLNSGALLNETDAIIYAQRGQGHANGDLRARVMALVFLINQLPSGGMGDTGLQATASAIADLLVEDLNQGSSRLRDEITQVLQDLSGEGLLMAVDGQYRLQTREGQEWDADFRARQTRIRNDDARITSDRADELKKALAGLRNLAVLQGVSKEKRTVLLHFGTEPPPAGEAIPVWVRDQWSVTEKTVREDAQREGMDSAIIHVFLPSRNAEELRAVLAAYGAAQETLATRPVASTPEGIEARASMDGRAKQERARLDGLLDGILKHAVVFQGGGVEVVEPSLQEALQRAMEASALRLYPRFADADQKGWDKVVDRAVQGNPSPMDGIGYTGDVMNHPVLRDVAAFLKTPRTGLQLRKHFGSPEFGWPQDAIDGAVLALIADGKVRANVNGKPRDRAELKRTQIGQTEFVLEDSPPSVTDRLMLRNLATSLLGAQAATMDDARLAEGVLTRLWELAQSAGGPPPLPLPPAPELLTDLRLTQGGRRIIEIATNEAQLRAWHDAWSALAQKAPARQERWERLQRLSRMAGDLPDYDEIAEHVTAIRENRLLLHDPDPTEAPTDRLVDGLRAAIRAAHDARVTAREREVQALEATAEWQQLTDLQWRKILAEHSLGPVDGINVGDDAAILRELERQPLATWVDRTAALPSRAAAAHQAAVKLLAPEAKPVHPKPATLKDEAEVTAYLDSLRAEIMAVIAAGSPVVITR